MKRSIGLALAIGFAAMPAPLFAETLTIEGVYPAGNDRAAEMSAVTVEQIGGTDGPILSTMIADRLRDAYVEGEPWLQVTSGSFGSDADAAINGYVSTDISIDESRPKEVKRCVRRDDDRKCLERREELIPCDQIRVRISPRLRMIDREGRVILTDESDVTRDLRKCADEESRSLDPLIEEALEEIAERLRYAIAPHQRREGIRVLESRKGMEKEAGRSFRDAIRLTKKDEAGACDAFAALEEVVGENRSLLFNLGLCAEAAEDLDLAESYYRRTLAVDAKTDYADQGLRRIAERRRAYEQLEIRLND